MPREVPPAGVPHRAPSGSRLQERQDVTLAGLRAFQTTPVTRPLSWDVHLARAEDIQAIDMSIGDGESGRDQGEPDE